jgi:hypothetical protein
MGVGVQPFAVADSGVHGTCFLPYLPSQERNQPSWQHSTAVVISLPPPCLAQVFC